MHFCVGASVFVFPVMVLCMFIISDRKIVWSGSVSELSLWLNNVVPGSLGELVLINFAAAGCGVLSVSDAKVVLASAERVPSVDRDRLKECVSVLSARPVVAVRRP